jgi:hypothetical protein
MTKSINVAGRTFQIRALTLKEVKKAREADQAGQPATLAVLAEWVLGEGSLDDVAFPEVLDIGRQVERLTYPTEAAEKNS